MGGGDTETVYGDVLMFDPAARTFRTPRLLGDASLLRRTAHGAAPHPLRPDCLLLFGGYGGEPDCATQEYR